MLIKNIIPRIQYPECSCGSKNDCHTYSCKRSFSRTFEERLEDEKIMNLLERCKNDHIIIFGFGDSYIDFCCEFHSREYANGMQKIHKNIEIIDMDLDDYDESVTN